MNTSHKVKVIYSNCHRPSFNLAFEDYIFRDMDPNCPVIFFWRNDQTIVIGRFQNPWKECHTENIHRDGIQLVRRQSGGGAVFQDLGNTNFTIMSSKNIYNKQKNFEIILRALQKFSIYGEVSGRNDLVIPGDSPRKFSGSAFKENQDRAFHHGTLLLNCNLHKLENYLNPHPKKLLAKGIHSVRSRVMNLSEISPGIHHEIVCNAILNEFLNDHTFKSVQTLEDDNGRSHFWDVEKVIVDDDFLKDAPKEFLTYYQKYSSEEWIWGETPQFTHAFEEKLSFGLFEVHLDVHNAIMKNVKIFTDAIHPEMIEILMDGLKNLPYRNSPVREKILELEEKFPMYSSELNEFGDWLSRAIE